MTASPINRFGSGRSVKRVEDDALLRGQGQFSDNLPVAGQLYACFVRSPHPHARITRIDIGAALAMPGVAAIFTGRDLVRAGVKPIPNSADFTRADGAPTATPPHHALAVDTVRFVGEAVAAVIAASPHEARDAAERIDVDYAPLPAVVDTLAATVPGAPMVVADAPGQHCVRGSPRRCGGYRSRIQACRARRRARPRQPARRAVSDRAALDTRHLRRSERAPHAARQLPDADRVARRVVRRSRHSEGERARARRRCRRRLRHEDQPVPGGRRRGVCRARVEAAGAFHRRAHRGISGGEPRSRRDEQSRAGARRRRPHPGVADRDARQRRRLRDARRVSSSSF